MEAVSSVMHGGGEQSIAHILQLNHAIGLATPSYRLSVCSAHDSCDYACDQNVAAHSYD
jgi:hypothetical protein